MTNEYDFLKKQRYEYYKGSTEIMDNEANELVEDVVDVLDQKDYNIIELLKIKQFQAQRIAELEEELKNSVRPKFKIGQEVWFIYGKSIRSFTILRINVEIRDCVLIAYSDRGWYQYEENCFTTKEEAQAKLEELQGENK